MPLKSECIMKHRVSIYVERCPRDNILGLNQCCVVDVGRRMEKRTIMKRGASIYGVRLATAISRYCSRNSSQNESKK